MAITYFTKTCPHCLRTFQTRYGYVKCCSKHCARKVQYGPVADRLLNGLMKLPDAPGCWLWIGPTTNNGYGIIGDQGVRRTHRVSYELHVGPIPKGLQVLHRCDTPPCVNPAHLFLGTRSDNMQDATKKGRMAIPTRTGAPTVRLTEPQVREIIASTERHTVLAARYGISAGYVSHLKIGRSWKLLPRHASTT